MNFHSDKEKELFEEKFFDGMSVQEEFFLKGKLFALWAIWEWMQQGGGSARNLSYGVLNVPHADALDLGIQEFSNWFFDVQLKPEPPPPPPPVYDGVRPGDVNVIGHSPGVLHLEIVSEAEAFRRNYDQIFGKKDKT